MSGSSAHGWRSLGAALAAALMLATACGGPGPAGSDDTGSAGGSGSTAGGRQQKLSGDVVVFAASSLTEAFGRLGREFEAAHPGVTMTFSFAGSSELGPQITAGAPADVFAAASPTTMADVVRAGATAGQPVLFARNRLEIAVPPDNPGHVTGLDDFARPELKIAVCAPQVPCGEAAQEVFRLGQVRADPDTFEQEVKGVVTKVELGEVDAGMVYRTDVRAAGDEVTGINFPEASQAINDYQIATIADAPNPAAAKAWMRYVLSPHGQKTLAHAGFQIP
jgi:molybdate transport system substrate-binding protein